MFEAKRCQRGHSGRNGRELIYRLQRFSGIFNGKGEKVSRKLQVLRPDIAGYRIRHLKLREFSGSKKGPPTREARLYSCGQKISVAGRCAHQGIRLGDLTSQHIIEVGCSAALCRCT